MSWKCYEPQAAHKIASFPNRPQPTKHIEQKLVRCLRAEAACGRQYAPPKRRRGRPSLSHLSSIRTKHRMRHQPSLMRMPETRMRYFVMRIRRLAPAELAISSGVQVKWLRTCCAVAAFDAQMTTFGQRRVSHTYKSASGGVGVSPEADGIRCDGQWARARRLMVDIIYPIELPRRLCSPLSHSEWAPRVPGICAVDACRNN